MSGFRVRREGRTAALGKGSANIAHACRYYGRDDQLILPLCGYP